MSQFIPTRINRPAGGPDLDAWNQAFPDGGEARELVRRLKRAMRARRTSDRALTRAKAQLDAKVAEARKLCTEVMEIEKEIAATAWYGGETPMTPMEMVRVMADSAAFPTDESSSESESSAQSGSSEEETEDDEGEDESEPSVPGTPPVHTRTHLPPKPHKRRRIVDDEDDEDEEEEGVDVVTAALRKGAREMVIELECDASSDSD